ncbi:MAG TPA: GNAT family N-acetyltransferase, partial [Bacteroidales bacterium]|nr:GNAT family N-acetyltransferase [Bacteroidales bacterium]
ITNNGRRLYLHHMGVLGDLQGQGIGQMLMDFVNDFAAEKQLQIKLEVHQKNQNAQKLYRSNGFTLLEGYDVLIRRNF